MFDKLFYYDDAIFCSGFVIKMSFDLVTFSMIVGRILFLLQCHLTFLNLFENNSSILALIKNIMMYEY